MSSTFKFHSQLSETVPWQAQYTFPTQATRVNKYTVKLPPKNGQKFLPGNIVRIEFPADNYLNTLNSVLQFDFALTGATVDKANTRLQRGGAQNVIKRLRVLYGSMVIEDIQEYKTIVRLFTECGVQDDYMSSLGTILDGMYATSVLEPDATAAASAAVVPGSSVANDVVTDHRLVGVELSSTKRTYCLNLLSGLLTSKKLLPLKYMAAQLAIEITLSDAADCLLKPDIGVGFAVAPSYEIDNINFIAELSEFDSTYDMAFQMGLRTGVPIKFASWHYHNFTMSGNNTVAQIHERSRSIKAAFAVMRDGQNPTFTKDTDRFFYNLGETHNGTGVIDNSGTGAVTEFQWRVGGKYYPSQPVRCTFGASEALVELLKSLNMLGDYTRASAITYKNWVSSKFIISCEFEHTDVLGGDTIAGINAEEQSDIALTIKSANPSVDKRLDVFMYYDSLLIIKEMNTVDLVL